MADCRSANFAIRHLDLMHFLLFNIYLTSEFRSLSIASLACFSKFFLTPRA